MRMLMSRDDIYNPPPVSPTILAPRPLTKDRFSGRTPSLGIVDQFDSEAVFKQNQFIVNINAHLTPNLGLSRVL